MQQKGLTTVNLNELEQQFLELLLTNCLEDLDKNKNSFISGISEDLKGLLWELYEKIAVPDSKVIN